MDIRRIIEQHLLEGHLEISTAKLLQSIAHGESLEPYDEEFRTFIIELHSILGQVSRSEIDLRSISLKDTSIDLTLRITTAVFQQASPEEVEKLYSALGQLLYGPNWQPTPTN